MHQQLQQRQCQQLLHQLHQYQSLPEVLDYILQKKEVYELEATIKNWERKIEIADMEARVVRQQRRAQRM